MEKKDPPKYKEFDSSSETSSVGSDESQEQAAGPNFADFARQLTYATSNSDDISYYYPFEKGDMIEKKVEGSYVFPSTITTKVEPPKSTDVTTLYLIDSLNRDRKAFPQPTSLTLRLPRVYRNVKSVQLTQVKMLCSFYYFSPAKSNIYLPVRERGREYITTFNRGTLTKKITIRQGTFGINDLLKEIQTGMNYTPVFYDFPNGFTDFINIFTVNGDFSINFNQPGDSYYDRLNSKYIDNPTMATILSYYWGSRYAGLLAYSMDQLKVAYYYPVFYEVFLDSEDTTIKPLLNLSIPPNLLGPGETVYSHLIFNMSGINDPVALYLINKNITLLDTYRLNNTFRYSLVNRYQLAYDSNSLQVNFITTSLNTSLVNLITNTGSASLTSILTNRGLTIPAYTALQNTVAKATVIYSDMFNFLQTQLTRFLGIPFATYGPQYFNTIENTIYFQNGLSATGIRSGYSLEYLTSGEIPLSTMVNTQSNSPGYWPNLNAANGYPAVNPSTINAPYSLIPYNIYGKNFQFNTTAIDSSNYFFNTNESTRSVDVMVKILPAQYSIFKFRSSARQTLQVETLPLPYYYRYADYNVTGLYKGVLDLNRNNVPQEYFDLSYNFVYTSTNSNMDSTNYSPNLLNPIFGQGFQTSLITSPQFKVNSQTNYLQFQFVAPYPEGISTGICANATSLSIVSMVSPTISTFFTDNFSAFVYHDRGAYMADVQFPRSENPLHYIKTASVTPSNSDLTIHFSTFSGHTYYTVFRSNNLACSNVLINPVVYYNDSNYVQVQTDYVNFNPNANPFDQSNLSTAAYVTNYNTDFTRLPTNSTLMAKDPTSSSFNVVLTIKGTPIGYDISGVSNDLTDYMGYVSGKSGFDPTTQFRIDPLSYYTFQFNSPFDQVNGTYFASTSQNSLLQPITNNAYTFKGISSSQAKIVHWYNDYSIPKQLDDPFTTFKTIGIAQTSNITEFISAYPQDPSKNIILGRGINAIGFLPNDGLFEVSSFTFKSSIYPLTATQTTSEDPNLQIKYVGVFSGLSLVNSIITLSSALTVLKYSRSIPYGPNTVSRTPGFGSELGTWYEYIYDPSFVAASNVNISGYTPLQTDLLSYNSLYYMVPFSAQGANLTYSLLTGSILPYPIAQVVSTGSTFFGKTAQNTPGAIPQSEYVMPRVKNGVPAAYGPQSGYSLIQSQYQQSIPITTTSIGYKQLSFAVNDSNALYPFTPSLPVQLSDLNLVTYFSEYSDTVFLVNSGNQISSNSPLSFQGANYASSLSTLIGPGSLSSIQHLINPAPSLQNYSFSGSLSAYSTFTFSALSGDDSNVTTRSIELTPAMSNITLWMWGGGGGTWSNTASISGGAGAYIKVTVNPSALLGLQTPDAQQGISTLYLVVGKGGNRDNVSTIETIGTLQLYEQTRYGGGGTSLLGDFLTNDSLGLQGGGFSGIFASPNLKTATPLLIVGGGGAAGSISLGGPGGIGLPSIPLTVLDYPFSTAIFSGEFYTQQPIVSVQDVFVNPVLQLSTIQNITDSNLTTLWKPSIPAKLNPGNYSPSPNTYGFTLTLQNPLQSISKLRYYGPPQGNTSNLPTGFTIYNSQNKAKVLYSNLTIQPSDFQIINNGQFLQQIYEIYPTGNLVPTTLRTNAWLIGGANISPQRAIQYSLDGIQWIPTNNTLLTSVNSLVYSPLFSKWFAVGTSSTPIISSTDGFNWVPCSIIGFTGSSITALALGPSSIILGGNNGQLFSSSDGLTWTSVSARFSSVVIRIRYVNDIFWALGGSSPLLQRSSDGLSWSSVGGIGITGLNDIAYGVGRYVIAQVARTPPFFSGLIYTNDGINWVAASPVNINAFSGVTVVFANGTFVAAGTTTDSTSFIKYSIDGINWLNSSMPSTGKSRVNDLQFVGNKFIASVRGIQGTGLAGNQLSVLTSSDGKTWSYSFSGGFDPDISSTISIQGNSSAYGPVIIQPDLTTLYIEIQKTSFLMYEPWIYEMRIYDTVAPISANTSLLIDTNLNTIFYPSEEQTVDVIEYPFLLSLASPVPLVNKIQIYSPVIPSALFTGITVSIDGTNSGIIFTTMNVTQSSFTMTRGRYLYEVFLIPSLVNFQKIHITFFKATANSLQIADINALYDPNLLTIQKIASEVVDLDKRPPKFNSQSVSNVINTTLTNFWNPASFIPGDTLKLILTFPQPVDRINHLQIYNGPYPSISANMITSIYIYTDSKKSILLYSNTNPVFTQYLEYSIIEFAILPLLGYSSLYVELGKTTPGIPIINEIKFFNVGILIDTPNGFSGGNTVTMNRSSTSRSIYDGGGGSTGSGGSSGPLAYRGNYLTGGSPAILPNQQTLTTTSSIQNGSGGGGGGYYGGGGGGAFSNGTGGAGGGGSGYIYSTQPIFTILDAEVANPGLNTLVENYISPGASEQQVLIDNNIIQRSSVNYGQGGSSVDSGKGGHGIIALTYQFNSSVTPPPSASVSPSFIDGSKLSVIQAPIVYNTEIRNLPFISFQDSIQLTHYAPYNWVWYSSYLSLIGCSLLSSFLPNSLLPIQLTALLSFPSLPINIYSELASSSLVSLVHDLYTNGITATKVTTIVSYIQSTFIKFQDYFITVPYTDPSYYGLTELYCLLDYLQQRENLENPHVRPSHATLDRLLGGVPRFGYWANPFFTNVSYVGFDVSTSQIPSPALSALARNDSPVQAIYGLILEQSLITGAYEFKDIMAYKPSYQDSLTNGSSWLTVTQFPQAYIVRSLTNSTLLAKNIPVQPFTFRNAISARLPLFNYKVYTVPTQIHSSTYDVPIQVLNDFQGQSIYMYSFQNTVLADQSTINISQIPMTSTTMRLNQKNISNQLNATGSVLGTLVSEYTSTIVQAVTSFGFNGINYIPQISYGVGKNNFYNTFSTGSQLLNTNVGKALVDVYGNYFMTDNQGTNVLYENIGTSIITPVNFQNTNITYNSPRFILQQYNANVQNPVYDFFESKYTNMWHLSARGNVSTIFGLRLTSPYDFSVVTNFANQIFYPTHKITLIKKGSLVNPITNTTDVQTYPSYQHTQMFFYKNYSTLVNDISGQYAMEQTSNFSYSDMSSGYGFNSYIYNINLSKSTNFNNDNADSFNYLAIRGYSPSETFQSLVRFYLPQRYDFGYITLKDLSNEPQTIATLSNVNPDYKSFLNLFNTAFSTNRVYGSVGVPGFSGSNISTVSFGDFLNQYNKLNTINSSNAAIISTVTGQSNASIANLITGDLQYILPPYLANRNRTTDPLEFSIPFSSCVTPSNANSEQYGLGYNIGFELHDTPYNTVQRATSFFKILDDYIYLKLNEEYGMNKMDVSQPENFAQTLATTSQSGLYNSKLILNSFGSFATTFVQSPVTFNPPVGKIDKLSFNWYDANGVLLNNFDCDWSGTVQIVESVTASA